jgi:hypothetical protein
MLDCLKQMEPNKNSFEHALASDMTFHLTDDAKARPFRLDAAEDATSSLRHILSSPAGLTALVKVFASDLQGKVLLR